MRKRDLPQRNLPRTQTKSWLRAKLSAELYHYHHFQKECTEAPPPLSERQEREVVGLERSEGGHVDGELRARRVDADRRQLYEELLRAVPLSAVALRRVRRGSAQEAAASGATDASLA